MRSLAVDAMGGDFGIDVTVPASVAVLQELPDVEIVLVGDRDRIENVLRKHSGSASSRLRVQYASEEVEMSDAPVDALKKKQDSSMHVALRLVKSGEVQACVSAGNTGALMATAFVLLRTFEGIKRPAIISKIPTLRERVFLLDLGANFDCSDRELFQFGIMGCTYVKYMEGLSNPKVALLNIGTEQNKGPEVVKAANQLFQDSHLNYLGYVEGDDLLAPKSDVDVIVCDGFPGNIALKTSEGVSSFIQHSLKDEFQKNIFRKLSGLFARPALKGVKSRIDPRVFNGAALVGLKGTVIKSHGSADILAYTYAIKKAFIEIKNDVPAKINQEVSAMVGRAT